MNYYYLISSLPDLSLDVSLKQLDFEETFDTIKRNLEPEDLELFYYLLYPNDNRNLLTHLFHEFKDLPKEDFLEPFSISPDAIQSYRREQATFPDYLVAFLQEFETQFPSLTMREMENRLQTKFEEALDKLEDDFLKSYFHFKSALKRLVAVFNQSQFNFLSETAFQDENSLLDSLKKGQTPSAAILKTYPFAESLRDVVDTSDPYQIERFVEEIEWDYLSGSYTPFESEQVLAYTARLLLLSRKKQQNLERGAIRFNKLKRDIRNKVHSPKTPVV